MAAYASKAGPFAPADDEDTQMEATGRDTGRSFLVAYNPNRPRTVDLGCVLSIEHTGVVCAVRFSPDGFTSHHITSHHITSHHLQNLTL